MNVFDVVTGALVADQQVVAETLFTIGELADAVGHHRGGDQGEQAGQDQHADVGVPAQAQPGPGQHQQQSQHLGLTGGLQP